jgi:membrane protease YdiL (CAAX protease family)
VSEIQHLLSWPFWNARQRRVRAVWRFAIFMALLLATTHAVFWAALRTDLPLRGLGIDAFVNRSIINCVLAAGFAAGCTFVLDRRGFDALGWVPSPRWWADLVFGAFLGAALISGVVAIERAAGWLTPVASHEPAPGLFLLKALALFVVAGAFEEIAFRSYMLRNFADGLNHRRIGPALALAGGTLGSSLLFGLAHAQNPSADVLSITNISLAGVFLAAGYVLTGRLALPLGLHVAWNYFQGVVFGVPVSGHVLESSLFKYTQGGPNLWTGGPFGIEGGLLGLYAMLVGLAAIAAWVYWREGELTLATSLLYDERWQPPAEETGVLA